MARAMIDRLGGDPALLQEDRTYRPITCVQAKNQQARKA